MNDKETKIRTLIDSKERSVHTLRLERAMVNLIDISSCLNDDQAFRKEITFRRISTWIEYLLSELNQERGTSEEQLHFIREQLELYIEFHDILYNQGI